MGREGHGQQITLACVGSGLSGITTLDLSQPKVVCTFRVHTAQALECSAGALSQVGPALCALPRYKSLRFLGASQGHRPRWAVHFVHFPGLNSSGNWVLGEHTVPGGLCILCTSLVLADQFPGCTHEGTVSCVLCVSSGDLISGCETPARYLSSRIPGRGA